MERIEVLGVASISQLVALLRGDPVPEVEPIEVTDDTASGRTGRQLDLADVVGQVEAKWACEVAAAGRHHMLFHSPSRGSARPCLRSGFRACCPIWTCTTLSRCRHYIPWLGSTWLTS